MQSMNINFAKPSRFTARPAAVKIAFLVLASYLLWPALFADHAEGFSAQLEIAALSANAGIIEHSNLLYPLHAEYFYLSRVGVVYLLQALTAAGTSGDMPFRLLTLLCYVVFVASSLAFARRRGSIGLWWGAAALLLAPGLTELAFYYNDAIASTAFALSGLASLPSGLVGYQEAAMPPHDRQRQLVWAARAFLAGALLSFAVLCRPDAALLFPLALGLCYLDNPRWIDKLGVMLIGGAGVAAILLLSDRLGGSSIFQSLGIGNVFLKMHTFPRPRINPPLLLMLVVGLPLIVLLPIGAVLQWRGETGRDALARRLVLIVLPAAMLLYFYVHALEIRHFYPSLAPFVAMYGGRGLQWLIKPSADEKSRRQQRWVIAFCVVMLLFPPYNVRLRDGPRAPLGRLWSPLIWRDWQEAVRGDMDNLRHVIDKAETVPSMTVITANYNSDHYLRMILWQRGYQPHYSQEYFPACVGGFEVWERPGHPEHRLLHVRTENAHVNQRPLAYTEAIQLQRAFNCPPVLHGTPVMLTSLGPYNETEVFEWLAQVQPAAGKFIVGFGLRYPPLERLGLRVFGAERGWFAPAAMARNRSVLLSDVEIAGLSKKTDEVVRKYLLDVAPPLRTYEGIMKLFAPHVAWPQRIDGHQVWKRVPPPIERPVWPTPAHQ